MSVSPIGAGSISAVQQQPPPSQTSDWQNMLGAVSSTLGMSTSALQQQLQSGSSLSSIAQSKGISQQSLLQTISTALTQNGSTASGSQLQQIATNIANRTPGAGGHHHHHHGGAGGASTEAQSSASTALEGSTSSTSSTDSLLSALTSGNSSFSSAGSLPSASDRNSSSSSTTGSLLGSGSTGSGINTLA